MDALIAGRCWRATHVRVLRRNGFVAIFGAGDDGIAVTFAVPLEPGTAVHTVEFAPPAAALVVGDDVLTASAGHGEGAIVVNLRTASRLAGSFSLIATGRLPGGLATLVRVTGGRFDVLL